MEYLDFSLAQEPAHASRLREEVRDFLARELGDRASYSYLGAFDPEFSRLLATRGWVGMSIPRRYGGPEKGAVERYVVAEELLAAHAPLSAHWIADRQSAPLLLHYGTEAQREALLPRIARGECAFCIGMSEPGAGSDLAAVRTRAEKVDGGWRVNGAKIWTGGAHRADYMILLCRTRPRGEDRHAGLSQLLIDMKNTQGIVCRQISNMAGEKGFNEVHFNDAFVPDDALIGQEGDGWRQVTSELAFERSGPERFLSNFGLVSEFARHVQRAPTDAGYEALGRIVAPLQTLRRLSLSLATMQEAGSSLAVQAALVKDLGTNLEQEICEIVRNALECEPDTLSDDSLCSALAETMLHAPSATIRGGTREVLRGMVARGIGLR